MKNALLSVFAFIYFVSIGTGQNCNLSCLTKVNVSLNPNGCMATLSPLSFLKNASPVSASCVKYELRIIYPFGTHTFDPPNKVDNSHQGYSMKFQVIDSVNNNSCWGYLSVNKCNPCAIKSPPEILAFSVSPSIGPYPAKTIFNLAATATDNVSVTKVEFYDDFSLLGTDNTSPYSLAFTSYNFARLIKFKAIAYDNCGVKDTSDIILRQTEDPECDDLIKNGNETGVDCGGYCHPCVAPPPGAACVSPVTITAGTASQSSTYSSYAASLARDASLSTYSRTGSGLSPWWQLDLGVQKNISSLEIRNRYCYGCGSYLTRYNVFVSPTPITTTDINVLKADGTVYEFPYTATTLTLLNMNFTGRYIRIWAEFYSPNSLSLLDVKVIGCDIPTPLLVQSDGNRKFNGLNVGKENSATISVFPNPTSDILYFSSQDFVIDHGKATITDIFGRKLLSQTIKEPRINISSLQNGYYLLHLDIDGSSTVYKVLKK